MAGNRGTETEFELTTIERLEALDYTYQYGMEIDRPLGVVVLKDALRAHLAKQYPDLPEAALDAAVERAARPEGADTLHRNTALHLMLDRGFELPVELPDGRKEIRHLYLIDWDEPENNDFRVVNQFPVSGQNDRRPDIVVFVNGLPLVVFELKNPWLPKPTVDDAFLQIQHYRNDIPQLFDFCEFVVVSDGVNTQHGVWPASWDFYAPWKSIDGFEVEPGTTGTMKMLIEGLFPKDRLLSYLRNFIVFEDVEGKITKKGAKYHQFFAARIAAEKAIEACRPGSDKRIGVIWHSTGSGKSLSMAFLVGMLRRPGALDNPMFVIEVDRNDLDEQLHDSFVAARSLVGDVKQADSVDELREMLQTEGGEVIFTTVEKFRLKREDGEIEHPVLSERSDVIIIADEAHRSQYGFRRGYAHFLDTALPNARRIGFTGTPISFSGADTVDVFGDLIHTYDMKQSQDDGTTKPIYYEARQAKLHLNGRDVDSALEEITKDAAPELVERRKGHKWAALAAAAGTKERVEAVAKDILEHFRDQTATLDGKAMLVCMTRENCVRMYDRLMALEGCPDVKVVMTGNLSEDPAAWSEAGHITTKTQREAIKGRMIDADDPLKIAIVCDMWLTGTDIPCLHTLYVDKPMRGHTLIQAISRVNRVFAEKPAGLIVDYIGIGDQLREAAGKYTAGGGRGNPAPDVTTEAKAIFFQCVEALRGILPDERDYGGWRKLSRVEVEDLYSFVYGVLAEDDQRRNDFLAAEKRLSAAFTVVKRVAECRKAVDEVIFYQRVRKQIRKTVPGTKVTQHEIDSAVRDLTDDAIDSEGVVDIFAAAGIERPDISILDDRFLQTFKDRPMANLRLKLLEKLMRDEIQLRAVRNLKKYRSFKEMLEKTIREYHNRTVDAAKVVDVLISIKIDIDSEDARARELGLEPEEVAFYDAVAENVETAYEQDFLRDLIHEIVQTVKRNLKVDWTKPHREAVKAEVRTAVRRVLRRRNVKPEHFDLFVTKVMEQAEALYDEWPPAA